MRFSFLYVWVFGFVVGIAFSLLYEIPYLPSFIFLGVSVLLGGYWFVSRSKSVATVFLILLGIGIGGIRGTMYQSREGDETLLDESGNVVTLEGSIVEEPVVTEKSQKIIFKTDTGSKIITFGQLYPIFTYGDQIRIQGTLSRPEAFETESGKTFNYPAYLAKDGIFWKVDKPSIVLLSQNNGNPIKNFFITVRRAFVHNLEELLPQPHAALASGIVLGVDGGLDTSVEEMFRRAGLIHIVVVSGYNITVVGEVFLKLLSGISMTVGWIGSILGICSFVLLTGASATALRAAGMAFLLFLARLLKRRYNVLRALVITGVVMVFHTPGILLFDPSFELSFLATWGLIVISPLLEERLQWATERFGLRSVVSATLGTQIAVSPLLLFQSSALSVVSLPANILTLFLVPPLMFTTLLTGVVALFGHFLALPFAMLTYLGVAYILKVTEFFGSLPFAQIHIEHFSTLFLIGAYGVILGIVYSATKRKARSASQTGPVSSV